MEYLMTPHGSLRTSAYGIDRWLGRGDITILSPVATMAGTLLLVGITPARHLALVHGKPGGTAVQSVALLNREGAADLAAQIARFVGP